jgi:hypothetical protein
MRADQDVLPDEEMDVLRLEVVRILSLVIESYRAENHEQVAVVRLHLGAAVRIHHIFDRQRVEAEDFLEERKLLPDRYVDVHPERSAPILHARRQLLEREVARNNPARFSIEGTG